METKQYYRMIVPIDPLVTLVSTPVLVKCSSLLASNDILLWLISGKTMQVFGFCSSLDLYLAELAVASSTAQTGYETLTALNEFYT